MSARRYGLIVVLLLIPVEARAHLHKAGAFFGPSFGRGSRLDGFTLGGEFMLPKKVNTIVAGVTGQTKKTGWLSVLLATSTNWGKHDGGDLMQFSLSGGLRATYAIPVLDKAFEVYGHATGALVHTQGSTPNSDKGSKGGGLGGGVTIDLSRPLGLQHEVVARVQYDHLWLKGDIRRYELVSVGIEYRFGSYAKAHPHASTTERGAGARAGGR
jgi:hypothetical protein